RRVGAGGADELAEGVVFVRGSYRAVGRFDHADHVAFVVVGGELRSLRGVVDRDQAADTTGALQRAAHVRAPDVAADQVIVCRVEFGDQVPAGVEKAVGDGQRP